MPDHQMTTPCATRCEMRWVTVQDELGRAHLEARWVDPGAVPVEVSAPAA